MAEDKDKTSSPKWAETADHAAAFIEQAQVVKMLLKTSGWVIHKQRKGPKNKKAEEEFALL